MSDSHLSKEKENQQQASNKWEKMAQEAERKSTSEPQHIDFPDRKQLEDQLTAAEAKAEEYKQQALRARAEMENALRRAEKDISHAHKFGVEQLIQALLPAVDALNRGLENVDAQDAKSKVMRDGMQLTLDLLHKALAKFGVESISPAAGDPFDPRLHEAMGMQAVAGAGPNTVLQVLQKGYQLHGRVLRAAMVMVAK